MSGTLEHYVPPEWAMKLSCEFPTTRANLVHANTPIHKWNIPGAPAEFDVSIKRDDLTGSSLSGSKTRKLEFLLGAALEKGCRHVITCGSTLSNQCRATCVACRQLGLTPHVILRSEATDSRKVGCQGNFLLDRLCGAEVYLVPWESPYKTYLEPRVKILAEQINSISGEDSSYIITQRSDPVGAFGYYTFFEEMRQQGVLEQFDDLFFACCGGATAEALATGNYLTGGKLKLHPIAVKYTAEFLYDGYSAGLAKIGLGHVDSRQLMRVVEGYAANDHGRTNQEQQEYVEEVATKTGIILDPVYTGKAAMAMVKEMQKNPEAFKGRRVLFLHTGGIFGLYGQMEPHLERDRGEESPIHMWPEVKDCPPLRNMNGDALTSQ